VGGEPVLAAFKRDEVLRAPSADRGVEPESIAYALGQSWSREVVVGDTQCRVEAETGPASATGEDQRGHDGAGEAREVSNRQQTLRSSQNGVGELGQAAQAQTEAELRAGGEVINAQASSEDSGYIRWMLNRQKSYFTCFPIRRLPFTPAHSTENGFSSIEWLV